MGWHPDNQTLDRVRPNGPIDLQSDGLAVSESTLHMTIQSLQFRTDLLRALKGPVRLPLSHETKKVAASLSQLSDCTPYLLQLGLTKSRTSLVWITGPLSGLIMQPVVGVLADNSRSKWGRRRLFMIGGALIVAVCLLVLG